jgi:hypothetical protein
MNADEIVRALRECGDCDTCPYYSCWIDEHTGDPADACDEGRLFRDVIALIESLQAQLAASQRRERAAVEDLRRNRKYKCDCCHYANKQGQYIPCRDCQSPISNNEDLWQWRGPQAGEVEP